MASRYTKSKWRAFFDIGHAKCRVAIISPDFSDARFYEEATRGLARGKVSNPDAFSSTIRSLVEKSNLTSLNYTAVASVPCIQTRTVVQTINHRLSGVYRSSDHSAMIEYAMDSVHGGLDEVVDILTLQFKIDGVPSDPLSFGTAGRDASARFMIATHPSLVLADILACINSAGVEVSEFKSNSFGVARALSCLRSQSENSVLLDIGHSSISGALMVGGVINQVFCVPAGSGHISKDLAAGLGITLDEADALKMSAGISETIAQADVDRRKIARFALPRVTELLSLAFKNFSIYGRSLDGGLLFCGAGASLMGLAELTSRTLGVKTPFVAQLTESGAKTFIGISRGDFNQTEKSASQAHIDRGWVTLLAHARAAVLYDRALTNERNLKPLSKLRPLWTWLSELSR